MKFSIRAYLSNWRLVFFGFATITILGLLAWFNLPREMMPSIQLPVVLTTVVLPGASPQDIEDLITIPIEDSVRTLSHLSEFQATSLENVSMTIAQFEENVSLDDAKRLVQDKLNNLNLPADAQPPQTMTLDFTEIPVWTFAIQGQDKLGLRRLAEDLEELLEREASIDRVEISGISEREIVLYVDPSKITHLGLSPLLLANTISAATGNFPAGNLETQGYSYAVSLDKTVTDVQTLRALPIRLNGSTYRLDELAAIYETDQSGGSSAWQMNSQGVQSQIVVLTVYKVAGEPIDANARLARRLTEEYLATTPAYKLQSLIDYGQEIADIFDELTVNILATICLVFLVMLIFLGAREAFISITCIPLTMLLTFAGMRLFNLSLNYISLFSLLLVLGMLVDNGIVITTALSRTFQAQPEQGALKAGIKVWREFFSALLATNLTTVWAFLPLVLITGMMGQFLRPISLVVTMAILGSAFIGFLLTLPLGILILHFQLPSRIQKLLLALALCALAGIWFFLIPHWLTLVLLLPLSLIALASFSLLAKRYLHYLRHCSLWQILRRGLINTHRLENLYRRLLHHLIRNPHTRRSLLAMMVVLTIFSFSLFLTGLVKSQFFPAEQTDSFEFVLKLPAGASAQHLDEVAQEILPRFADLPGLDYVTVQTARGGASALLSGTSTNTSILFTFNLVEEKIRPVPSTTLISRLRRDWASNPYGEVSISGADTMANFGADLELGLIGEDLDVLATKAEAVLAYLRQQAGVSDLQMSLADTSKRLVFVPNQPRLAQFGLTPAEIGATLRSHLSGWPLGTLRQSGEEIDLTWRNYQQTPTIDALEKISLSTSNGLVPLTTLGQWQLQPNAAQILRYWYSHVVTITGAVDEGYNATEINERLHTFVTTELNLPEGYRYDTQGAQASSQEATAGLQTAMLVAGLLILFTLVLQLHSFRKAFIVMSVIPVAISGVFIVFGIFNLPLSLPALIGVLALFGIVVNNSILIVERINQNHQEGKDFYASVIEGCTTRLQPILLTSLTTIIGLLPLTFSQPLWQGLGSAIIAGLIFSGTLLLLYIPVLYVTMFDPENLKRRSRHWRQLWSSATSSSSTPQP